MNWYVKHWTELTPDEVYDLLQARTAVFVVEQNCPYQDPDGLDRRAYHVFCRDGNGVLQAYLRVIAPEPGEDAALMGRVLTVARGTGLGLPLVRLGLKTAWERLGVKRVRIGAQSYAQGFYEKAGFRRTARPEYREDGIPHVEMLAERED